MIVFIRKIDLNDDNVNTKKIDINDDNVYTKNHPKQM